MKEDLRPICMQPHCKNPADQRDLFCEEHTLLAMREAEDERENYEEEDEEEDTEEEAAEETGQEEETDENR